MTAHKTHPALLPPALFLRRIALFVALAITIVAVSLVVGMIGYRHLTGMSWIDAFLNASMILTGMGPVSPMPTDTAKIFSSCYALYGGAVYPAVTALVLFPFLHRMLKAMHLEMLEQAGD